MPNRSKSAPRPARGPKSRSGRAAVHRRPARPGRNRPRPAGPRIEQGRPELPPMVPKDAHLPEAFVALGLSAHVLRGLASAGYEQPTPIQERAIPAVLNGCDLLAGAQTGTGKTAAFALPILHGLSCTDRNRTKGAPRHPRALILAPTRELAAQVEAAFHLYGRHTGLRSLAVFGGVPMPRQVQALRRGVDVIVATPGRLLDHLGSGVVDLRRVQVLVLDEADRMLDMGFLPDIRRVLAALPKQRQNLLFSATLSDEIAGLAASFLHAPVSIQVAPANDVTTQVRHQVHRVNHADKRRILVQLLREEDDRQTLVFCRTKHGADRLARSLDRAGLRSLAIHGNKSQGARTAALASFKDRRTTVLVATDIAARGLDIRQLPLVVNYDLPMVAEDYIHRIGRTGRAGLEGQALSLVSEREDGLLRDIQQLLGDRIEVVDLPGYRFTAVAPEPAAQVGARARGARPSRGPRPPRGGRNKARAGRRQGSPVAR